MAEHGQQSSSLQLWRLAGLRWRSCPKRKRQRQGCRHHSFLPSALRHESRKLGTRTGVTPRQDTRYFQWILPYSLLSRSHPQRHLTMSLFAELYFNSFMNLYCLLPLSWPKLFAILKKQLYFFFSSCQETDNQMKNILMILFLLLPRSLVEESESENNIQCFLSRENSARHHICRLPGELASVFNMDCSSHVTHECQGEVQEWRRPGCG